MTITLDLNSKEYQDLTKYCELNKLIPEDIVKKSYLEGFMIEKHGLLNGSNETKEIEVIKEVIKYVEVPVVEEKEVIKIEYIEIEKPIEKIVEVIKEIPSPPTEIEVIKYVDREVIKEVIKEVFVSNNDNIYDKTYVDELLMRIVQLENQEPKIVEVVVEKESNDGSLKLKLEALQNTLMKIRQENIEKDKKILEYEKTIEEIQKFQENKQAVYLNGSNLNNKLNN